MTQNLIASTRTERSGAEHHDARLANRNRILRTLISRGEATRAELSRRTGLSRPTVSVIASDLLTSGVITEGARVSSGGAPGTLLHISSDTGVTVVADLRASGMVTVATVSANGDVISRTSHRAQSPEQALASIVEHAHEVGPASAIGATVAVRGFADADGLRIAEGLQKAVDIPVLAVEAVDALAMADLRDDPEGSSGHATVMFPEATAGLIMHGELVTGWTRPVGDFSHLVPGVRGPKCPECGRTCLYAHARALSDKDTSANRRRLATALAAVLAPVIVGMEIQQVALAGLPEAAAGAVAAGTLAQLQERLPDADVPEVRVSEQGDDGVLVGAAALTLFSRLG